MKLLITTDGSEESKRIVQPAAEFAAAIAADVVLVRVFNPRTDAAGEVDRSLADATRRVMALWHEEMDTILREYGISGSATVITKKHGEDVVRTIVDYASEIQAGLIAMASRGAGRLRQAIAGSVATGALGHAACPVMVAGTNVEAKPAGRPYHIVATTDGSEAANAAVLALATLDAPPGAVRVTLVRAHEAAAAGEVDPQARAAATRELEALAASLPASLDVRVEVRGGDTRKRVDDIIVSAASELQADALWVGTHGHTLRARVFTGSTGLGIVGRSRIPVILIRK